jgi:hypothetical protein
MASTQADRAGLRPGGSSGWFHRALGAPLLTGLAALFASGDTRIEAQNEDRPVFRVETRFVEVDAYVQDRSGRFVADLTKDDFEVFEDGVRQEVEMLTRVHLPVDARPTRGRRHGA